MTAHAVAAAEEPSDGGPDLGDLVVVLLAGTLAGLRDRLHEDGFARAAELVGDLVEVADDYVTRAASAPAPQA
ncbi:MAG TPA: hypothetical protein VHJ34_08725 [Actinomycetota bacterium]|nr:hypothetical protein [Actinomycetota bacterium]